MNVLIAFLAVTGALAWLMVISGFIFFGVFFRAATAEDRAVVDLPDVEAVDVRDRLTPYTGVRLHSVHSPNDCDACTGRDRGAF